MSSSKNSKLIDKVENLRQVNLGIAIRKLSANNMDIYIVYIRQLVDPKMLSDSIIKPILQQAQSNSLDIEDIATSMIYVDDILIDYDESKIMDYILEGRTIIVLSNDDKYIVANTLQIEKRGIEVPDLGYALRGPKDSFIESIDVNLSLIRNRIKDPGLRIDRFKIGRRTKTDVAVVYIDELANPKYLNKIKERLQAVDVDGIFASGQIQKFLDDKKNHLFPQSGVSERPDTTCASILEGRFAIIVDGSNLAIITPRTFLEFFDSPDDHYDRPYYNIVKTFIRLLSILITLTLSSAYVAVVSYHTDILPTPYIIAIATGRATVPFNAFVEALGMEIISEILREASLRLPKNIGSAVGVVGTIVLGQAAVAAGLVSPLMVIIISLTTLASFVVPDFTIMSPVILVLKFAMIIITAIFGLFGFIMGFTAIMISILSLTTMGIPYFSPVAPFNFNDFKNYILADILLQKKRPEVLESYDKTKQKQ